MWNSNNLRTTKNIIKQLITQEFDRVYKLFIFGNEHVFPNYSFLKHF